MVREGITMQRLRGVLFLKGFVKVSGLEIVPADRCAHCISINTIFFFKPFFGMDVTCLLVWCGIDVITKEGRGTERLEV